MELFAADGHDAGGCERVTGKSGMRPTTRRRLIASEDNGTPTLAVRNAPGAKLGIGGERGSKIRHRGSLNGEQMTTEISGSQRVAVKGVPVEMVPTTAREHITGFAALNIPHAWRLGGDWHEAWFDVKPTRVSDHHITDERCFGRLLDQLGRRGLRDARPGLALLDHPARDWPEKVWAATHERAVIEMAWARLERMAGKNMPAGLPPVDQYDFYRILPHPDQWVRVRWWAWRLRRVLTGTELPVWDEWRKEWWP